MTIRSKWLDADGDEWWDIQGQGFRLAGRSPTSAMSGLAREYVEDRWGPLTPYHPNDQES